MTISTMRERTLAVINGRDLDRTRVADAVAIWPDAKGVKDDKT